MQTFTDARNESPDGQSAPRLLLDGESLLTVHEVAKILKVPVSWVYERTRRRGTERLPHMKIGKYLRFRKEDVLGWLDEYKI
jgi:excisionase family DNA binding protein